MENPSVLPSRRPFTFDRVVRIVFSFLCLCVVVWLLRRLSSVLLPFLVAWLIAYILEPFVLRNQRLLHMRKRTVPVLITLFEALLLAVVLGLIFIPSIIQEMSQVSTLIKTYLNSDAQIKFIPAEVHHFIKTQMDLSYISEHMTNQDFQSIMTVVGQFISGGVSFVMSLVNWFLVILYVVFIMLDYDNLLMGFKHMVPPRYRKQVFTVVDDVKESMNHYFRGQSLVALCVGILFSIGFLIVGLPLAVVLGLFIGVLNMVPYLQLISIVPTTILCLVCSAQDGTAFWPMWWECMAVYCIVQAIQDLVLTPKIMGKAMGLNPAIILLSLSVWGSLLGFIGLIIALPLTTLVLSYYNQYIIHRHDGETPAQRRNDSAALQKAVKEP